MIKQPKQNYQRKLEEIIKKIPEGTIPKLFLHACCAPCSSYVLEYLNQFFNITLFFYNPNIMPEKEYQYRLSELRRLISEISLKNPVSIVNGDWEYKKFIELAKGLEHLPERSERCQRCIKLRLEKTFQVAVNQNADFVTTTLSISPHKDAEFINNTGVLLSSKYNIPWLFSDFKKKGGYLRSIELSKKYELYRQDFCGCVYSRQAREQEKR